MTQELSSTKIIKSISYRHFVIELLEWPNGKYAVRWEIGENQHTSVDITALDIAMEMFSDILVQIERN